MQNNIIIIIIILHFQVKKLRQKEDKEHDMFK